jgi:signal transduction histidine kinase
VLAVVGAATAVSLYTFWRVDRVQENVAAVNQFYVPVLKHLNLLSGKWVVYQRSFEQSVAFRRWGTKTAVDRGSQLKLRKVVEADVAEIAARLDSAAAQGRVLPEGPDLHAWLDRLAQTSEREALTAAEIASLVHMKRYAEAAGAYSRARQEHLQLTQGLAQLSRALESRLAGLQLSTEEELRKSQSVMLLLLTASVLFSLVILVWLRRWVRPIQAWTRIAQRIAREGLHRGLELPRVARGMPAELALLTREFNRVVITLLERTGTVQSQKTKLESLNASLKETNEKLRKQGVLNERIIEAVPPGLLVINGEGVVEQFNDRYCELFGNERALVLGNTAADVLASSWPREKVSEWLTAPGARHVTRQRLGERLFDIRIQPLQAGEGRLLLFEDVTRLAEAEEKLEHARKLVLAGDLSAQVAHEVRNPLNSMALQLEMLSEDLAALPGLESASARATGLGEQVQRLERITRRYLDWNAGVSAGREPVDLHAVIERCVSFLGAEIQAAQVRLELKLNAAPSTILGDADGLGQVLMNLIRNSLEALREEEGPREITIETEIDGEVVQARVSDSGPGVAARVRERLFEPFVTDKAAGNGLGLSVSRQICIEHGGELRHVAGEAGASFEFSLPLKALSEEAPDANPRR